MTCLNYRADLRKRVFVKGFANVGKLNESEVELVRRVTEKRFVRALVKEQRIGVVLG